MKSRKLYICSSVALMQLLVGGSLLFSGCAAVEEDRLPPGAYVPPAPKEMPPSNTPETPLIDDAEPAAPKTVIVPIEEQAPVPKKTDAAPKKVKPVSSVSKTTHVVKKGDTFWGLAAVYGVTMDEIAAANPDVNPKKLHVGSKLIIPAHGAVVPKAGVKSSASKKGKTSAKTGRKTSVKVTDSGDKYIVRKGDSFARIASKHKIKAADLAAANNLSLEKPLWVGQKLVIPKPGAKVAKAAKTTGTASTKVKSAAPETPAASKGVAEPVPAAPALPDEVAAPEAPAVSAPAAPIASPAAVDAVAKDATPVAVPVAPSVTSSYTADVTEDTTIEELAKKYGFGVAALKKLNPEIPADGKVRAGSVIKLP